MHVPQEPTSPAPRLLIQMSGAPGSGKSMVARLLRPSIDGIIIDHDVLRSSLLESGIVSFDQAAKQAYHLQWAQAQDFISQGLGSVIIDSTCNYPEVLEQGISLAARHGYTYWYVDCKVADVDLLDRRMRARQSMASQRSAVECPPAVAQRNGARVSKDARALFTKWIDSPCRPENDSCVIIVDSTSSLDKLREQILKRLSYGCQSKLDH